MVTISDAENIGGGGGGGGCLSIRTLFVVYIMKLLMMLIEYKELASAV